MAVDLTNAYELAQITCEIGAGTLEGVVRYPSDTGGWLAGDLDRHRDQQVMEVFRFPRNDLVVRR